jgi:glutaredoxin-like protein
MIPLKDQEAIRVKFAQEMLGPVKIDYFTQKELDIVLPGREPCAYCKPTREMLQELAALSDLISLRVHNLEDEREEAAKFGVERIPGIVLRGRDGTFFKFYGMPGGSEFPSFLDTIVDVSRNEVLLTEESVKALRRLKEDVRVRVFVSPTCPYCPGMARAAFQMTLANAHVKAEVIEVNEFPDLAKRYNVTAVPLTLIEDRIAIPGAVPEKALVEQVLKAAQSPAAQPSEVRGPSTPQAPPEDPRGKPPSADKPAPGSGSGLILP